MKITVLGSGGWEGIPAPFCACRVCKSAKRARSKDNRTRPGLLVETKKGKFMMEISPDIRLQSARRGVGDVSDFFISHWHFDHMYGLLELHAWSEIIKGGKINIYCSEKTKEWLDRNFVHVPKRVVMMKPFETVKIYGAQVTAIPVRHMKGKDDDIPELELSNVFGFMVEEGAKRFVYLPDYFKIPKRSMELIEGADCVLMDGTYLFEERSPQAPMQVALKKDGDHMHGEEIFALAVTLDAKAVFFHSITHLTGDTHNELVKMMPRGIKPSYDGLVIRL